MRKRYRNNIPSGITDAADEYRYSSLSLPTEILYQIFGFFSKEECQKLSLVSKQFYSVIRGNQHQPIKPVLDYANHSKLNYYNISQCISAIKSLPNNLIAFATASLNSTYNIHFLNPQTDQISQLGCPIHTQEIFFLDTLATDLATGQLVSADKSSIVIWNMSQTKPARIISLPNSLQALKITPHDEIIAATSKGEIIIYNSDTGEIKSQFNIGKEIISVDTICMNKKEQIVIGTENNIYLYDSHNHLLMKQFAHVHTIRAGKILKSGDFVCLTQDGTLIVFDLNQGIEKLCVPTGHPDERSLIIELPNNCVATAFPKALKIYDLSLDLSLNNNVEYERDCIKHRKFNLACAIPVSALGVTAKGNLIYGNLEGDLMYLQFHTQKLDQLDKPKVVGRQNGC